MVVVVIVVVGRGGDIEMQPDIFPADFEDQFGWFVVYKRPCVVYPPGHGIDARLARYR